MNRFYTAAWILASLGFAGFMIPTAGADIYSWTDDNGVRHFTNGTPPKHAELLIKSPEISHHEEAHQRRLEEDKLALARQELAEKEALLLQQQLEAERRLAVANARAEAALRQADRILQEAEAAAEAYDNDRSGSIGFYYPYYRIGDRKYDVHYYRYKSPYRQYPHVYGHGKKLRKSPALKELNKKYRSIQKYHDPLFRAHRLKSQHSLARDRYPSHRERSAAFRGRHGRF